MDGGEVQTGVLLLQRVVVGHDLGRAIRGDVDKTIVVGLLRVLVDDAAAENALHLIAVDLWYLGEDTRGRCVAAKLGEEDGDRAALEPSNKLIVAGLREGAVATPRVGVEGEQVDAALLVLLILTLQILPRIEEDRTDIGSAVTDGDGTIGVLGDVVLEVTSDGANVRRDGSTVVLVEDDLVSAEEGGRVGVVLEGLDDGESPVQVGSVVRLPGRSRAKAFARKRRVDVQEHVHASLYNRAQSAHTSSHISPCTLQVDSVSGRTALKIEAHSSWFTLGSML